MNIDNSGPSIVFDAKTTQAIEEGKNRVTLLQVEELRLAKLNKALEGQIIKLEGDIAYKEGLYTKAEEALAEMEINLFNATEQLNSINKLYSDTKDKVEQLTVDLEERELVCTNKEKELKTREARVAKDEADIVAKQILVSSERRDIENKKKLIEDLVTKL